MSSSSHSHDVSKRDSSKDHDKKAARRAKELRVLAHRQKVFGSIQKQSLVIVPVQYSNHLPELPMEQRFIGFPFEDDSSFAYDLLDALHVEAGANPYTPEPDIGLGVVLGLSDPLKYTAPEVSEALHPADKEICSPSYAKPAVKRKDGVSGADASRLEFFMDSHLLHNDLYDSVYKHADSVSLQHEYVTRKKEEISKVERSVSKRAQVAASFAAAQELVTHPATTSTTSSTPSKHSALQHPSNAKLSVKRTWSLLPDLEAAGLKQVAVQFDRDPCEAEPLSRATKRSRISRSVIRSTPGRIVDRSNKTSAVHLLLPDGAESMAQANQAIRPFSKLNPTREYMMTVYEKKEEVLMLRWNDKSGEVFFSSVKTQAECTRSKKAGVSAGEDGEDASTLGARLITLHRGLLDNELEDWEEGRALVSEADPREILEKVKQRRRDRDERLKKASDDREARAIAAAAAAKATQQASQGSFVGGGGIGLQEEDDDFDVE